MKVFLTLVAALFFSALPAQASWHYNEDGGFGIYQPEGWKVIHEGRSSRLLGPESDSAQSQLFLGSDWISRVKTADDLKTYALQDSGSSEAEPITISELPGFRTGSSEEGYYYLLRIPENVIVVHFQLKGSQDQREEGHTMLSSIEIRTKGIEQ